MKHKIITDGVSFRVETGSGTTRKVESDTWISRYICDKNDDGIRHSPINFKSYKKAVSFIRKKYGTSATIEPRTWRAI